MDYTFGISSESDLRKCLSSLSRCLTDVSVRRVSSCLCRSGTITHFEAQSITSKATDVQKASELMLVVLRKGSRACSLFFQCLGVCDPGSFQRVTGCSVQPHHGGHHHSEDVSFSDNKLGSTPPVFISIYNSSLNNCIIGNNNSQSVTCDRLSSLPQNQAQSVSDGRNNRMTAIQDKTSSQSVHMEGSLVEYVIVGDQNCMTVNLEADEDNGEETGVHI